MNGTCITLYNRKDARRSLVIVGTAMPSRRRLPIAAAALLLLAAAGYTGFWFFEAHLVRSGLADWTAARRAEGLSVDYGAPQLSGFPFRIAVRLDHPAVAAPDQHWRWTGEAVEADVRPWAFHHVTVHPLGRQEVAFVAAGENAVASASAAEATAVVDVDARGRLQEGSFDAEALTLAGAGGPPALVARSVHLELAGPGDAPAAAKGPALPLSAVLSLRLEEVTLASAAGSPLGPTLGSLALEAQVRGPFEGKSPMQALTAWRDAGGTLELKSFALAWGPLQLAGNATLALDPNLQPEGAGTGEIRGFAETIDALVGQGLVKPDTGALAKAALGLVAKAPAGGGAKVLTVPLTIQKQVLYAGPFGLMRLPTIKWAG